MLVIGTAESLAAAEAELRQAAEEGETIMSLHAELQRLLSAASPSSAAAAEQAARARAVQVAVEFAQWYQLHGAELQRGLELLGTAGSAIVGWHFATLALPPPPPPASNVVSLSTPPMSA
jgi:hypothetical protein